MAEPNFQNRTLYHGDNLDFLRGMNSETVHLIATDPPFNKNRDFHATPDSLAKGARFSDRWSWERDVHEEWTDNIKDDWPAVWEVIDAARAAYGDDMGAFLCWLGVRLMEMHRRAAPGWQSLSALRSDRQPLHQGDAGRDLRGATIFAMRLYGSVQTPKGWRTRICQTTTIFC